MLKYHDAAPSAATQPEFSCAQKVILIFRYTAKMTFKEGKSAFLGFFHTGTPHEKGENLKKKMGGS
jgi:hypothetical protein